MWSFSLRRHLRRLTCRAISASAELRVVITSVNVDGFSIFFCSHIFREVPHIFLVKFSTLLCVYVATLFDEQ